MMKRMIAVYRAGLLCVICLGFRVAAEVVYSDDMQTLSGWIETSSAVNEPGDSVGGIRAVNYGSGLIVQMNSWWDGAELTSMQRNTGHIIRANTVYRCTFSIISFASGNAVTLKLMDADNGWSTIQTAAVNPSVSSYSSHFVFFDSSEYPGTVGHSLAVGVDAGLWNNLAITQVTVETSPPQGNAVYFSTTDPGVTRSLDFWGECQSWINGNNMTTCINYMGLSNIDVVRFGLDFSQPLTYSGSVPVLPAAACSWIDSAMQQVQRAPDAKLSIVPGGDLNSWYIGTNGKINPVRWVDAYIAAINYVNSTYGYTMNDWVFMEMFNEPDWNWSAGSQSNMAAVMAEYKTRSALAGIPLLGPSTLDCNYAQSWYNAIQNYTDIGGTHVINGSMSSLISFINTIHAAGKPFINPEIHTLVESIIHAEYSDRPGEGGIFWGDISPAEGRFVQACTGKRIAYATDSVTWTAACGYRDIQNRIWMFAAANERHSLPSMWEFHCSDRDVFFDGVGPARNRIVELPAGGDFHVEVTWGDRNPMYFNQYADNTGNHARMAVSGGVIYTTSTSNTNTGSRWEFRPVGAFYFIDNVGAENGGQNCRLIADSSTQAVTLSANTRTDDYAKWQLAKTGNTFYLENVGMQRDGKLCRLKAGSGSAVILAASSDETPQAVWSFTDTGVIDTAPPSAPTNLKAITGDSKIQLDWTDSDAWDFGSYSIYRKTNVGSFVKITSGLTESHYEDTAAANYTNYHYAVTAVDGFGNESAFSNEADMAAQKPIAYEDFQSGNFTGGWGWLAGWSTSGSPVVAASGSNKAVKLANIASMTRTLSNPVYDGILYFKYDVDALESDDSVVAEVYDWVSGQWVAVWSGYYYDNGLDTVGGGADTADYLRQQVVDLGSVCLNIDQIRFRAITNSSDDVLFIDDVAVFPKTYGAPAWEIVYSDNLTTMTNGWNEGSNAANEAGDSTGGIRAVDYGNGLIIQMNSWWDGAGWTSFWKNTGQIIQANTIYRCTFSMVSFAGGNAVTIKFMDVDNGGLTLQTAVVNPSAASFVLFDSSEHPSTVGHSLAIGVDAGWWNNLAVERVLLEKSHVYLPMDLDHNGKEDLFDFTIFSDGWQTNYGMNDLFLFAQNWLGMQ